MAVQTTRTVEELGAYCARLRRGARCSVVQAATAHPAQADGDSGTPLAVARHRAAPVREQRVPEPASGRGAPGSPAAQPGVPERTVAHSLVLAIQYLLPGEVAPAHRHSPTAIRFMLHGEGAFTTVDGQKCAMKSGDLVLTPGMAWHDHGNEGGAPVYWMDILDWQIVRFSRT